jgi:hypothetical protein
VAEVSVHGALGGDAIDFNAVASTRIGYIAVEPKICEWCCANFCRVVGSGAKECPKCSGRLERLASQPLRSTIQKGHARRVA